MFCNNPRPRDDLDALYYASTSLSNELNMPKLVFGDSLLEKQLSPAGNKEKIKEK